MSAPSTPAVRLCDQLAAVMGWSPTAVLRYVEPALADRVFAAAIAGATDAELLAIAGDALIQEPYRRGTLSRGAVGELRRLIGAARLRLAELGRSSAHLEVERARLAELLEVPKP